MGGAKDYTGGFEELVLLAIVKLGDNAYGISILDMLTKATKREISIGALYTTLSRLESKGLISSRMGDATAERGGRAKKYFDVTLDGKRALRNTERARIAITGI